MNKYKSALVLVLISAGLIELMYYMLGVSTPDLIIKLPAFLVFTFILGNIDKTPK